MNGFIIIAVILLIIVIFTVIKYRKSNKSSKISSSSSISPTIKKELNISFTQYKSKYDLLLHKPEWITCRDRILERDSHKCLWCGSTTVLQIHHKYYHKLPNNSLVNPWEYEDDCFITLCKNCHEKWHSKHQNKIYYRSYKEHKYIINKLKQYERNKNNSGT